MTQDPANGGTPQQRLAAYWSVLKEHKEKKTIRELVEREVLLCFIATNKDRINEYPLLPPQQHAIIDFLTTRAQGDPLHAHTSALITFFINQLNKYGGLLTTGDTAGAEGEVADLVNQESLLLKAIQAVVYTTALTVDNFSEVLIRHYGEESLPAIDAIMEKVELGERFWKENFDHFITKLADGAYREMTANQLYMVRREKSQIVLRFCFDDMLSRLKRTNKSIEKTRAQSVYETSLRTFEARKARKRLADHLTKLSHKPDYPFAPADIPYIASILCMDSAGLAFESAYTMLHANSLAEPLKGADGEELTQQGARFIFEQMLTMACATSVSLGILRQDFQKSLSMFESKEAAQIMHLLGVFDLESIERAFFAMLELQFISIIRQRSGEDSGKMQIRSTRLRRVREEEVDTLMDLGLNRIRKNKLWVKDPDNEEYLLFAQQSPADFKAIMEIMHLEPQLARAVLTLWQHAHNKVFISVHLNLDLISRTTTNLNQRLAEIFLRFGTLGPGKKKGI